MCGLAGTARTGGGVLGPGADGLLRRMGRAVAHRGPDGERIVRDGPVGLAFRRLALVDPTGGEQPLTSPDGSVVVIANGEIYNHRELEAGLPPGTPFKTRSDCEVLVHLYQRDGLAFLDGVLGMFAIVLWDRRRGRLLFARDRFGIKPLYYTHNGEALTFASEIKALFEDPACPRTLDWEAALADQALTAAPFAVHAPVNAWFRGVEVVPAATIVSFDLATGRCERQAYWRLPTFDGDSDASDAELVAGYRELLEASVADCASADAEVGLFLSGGVDSSAVAALAARRGTIHTFTVLNGSTLGNGDAEFAHRTAEALGLPNHQLLFDADRVPRPAEYRRLLWLLETPLCGPEQYYKYELYRYVKELRPGLKGMLLGQASDEFNGGYSPQASHGTGWEAFVGAVDALVQARGLHHRPELDAWWRYHDRPLLTERVLAPATPELRGDRYSAFVAWKYRTIQQYNCWHEDRTAAGNGVEARVPFLDHRIVELMAAVPAARRARLLWDKAILREAVADLLPEATTRREKMSFYHGEAGSFTHRSFVGMLAQDGAALVEESLSAPTARDLVDGDAVRDMLVSLASGRDAGGVEFLLRLVNLGLLERMAADVPPPPVESPPRALAPPSPIRDWDRDAPQVAARLGVAREPDLADRVALGDGVLLVRAVADPTTWFVAVDGQFEYVVDETEEPAWCRFLQAVDGQRSIAEVLEAAGVARADVAALLLEALRAGVLVVAGRQARGDGGGRLDPQAAGAAEAEALVG